MSFIWPIMFLLLPVLPVFVGLYLLLYARRRHAAARYAKMGMRQSTGGIKRHIPAVFFLLALAILVFALARPKAAISVPRVVGTVILAFDVSGSMAADDLKPTRMEAAKLAAQNFVERQPRTVQIGVVAFSDSGISVQAPTNEKDAVLAAIKRLAPERGTSLGNGMLSALKVIADAANPPSNGYYTNRTPDPTPSPTPVPKGTYSPAMVILLTDGENNENPDPLEVAQLAADRGIRIYTVGVGSVTGTDVKLEGFTVHTQLDEALLKDISDVTDGTYYSADDEEQLLQIYETIGTQLIVKTEETELTSAFAGASIFVMLIGVLLSLLWFGRLP